MAKTPSTSRKPRRRSPEGASASHASASSSPGRDGASDAELVDGETPEVVDEPGEGGEIAELVDGSGGLPLDSLSEPDGHDENVLHGDFAAEPAHPSADKERRTASLVKSDPLTAYMHEIRRYPLLSREEEHDLAVEFAQNRDPKLARRLITANLRLVVKIAHEYRRAYRNLLDLVQEGNLGL